MRVDRPDQAASLRIDFQHDVGDVEAAASGLASARAALAIARRLPGSVASSREQSAAGAPPGVVLRQQQGRAALHQEFGIAGLVVVDRLRQRHQHAAHADRAQFGERQRTGTADHQVGPCA
jgi:hypothetical protein